MPGFFGIFNPDSQSIRYDLQCMVNTLRSNTSSHDDWTLITDSFGIGIYDRDHHIHQISNQEGILVIDGEIFGSPDLKFSDFDFIDFFSEIIQEPGLSKLAMLNGAFSFVYFDKKRTQFILGIDRFGTYPIYYTSHKNRFAFSSKMRGLFSLDWIPKDPDLSGFAEVLNFGHFLNNHTYCQQIHRVAPATILTATPQGIQKITYWIPEFRQEQESGLKTPFQIFFDVLQTAVKKRVKGQIGLLLSGGIDSRMIASLVPKEANIEAFIYGLENSWDVVFGGRVARHIPCAYSVYILDDTITDHFEKDFIQLLDTGEGVPSLLGSYQKKVFSHQAQFVDCVLEGTGGGIARGSVYRRFYSLHQKNKHFRRAFSRSINRISQYESFFQPDFYRLLKKYLEESVRLAVEAVPVSYDIGNFLDAFYMLQRVGNGYGMANNYEKHFIRSRLPFFDYQCIDVLLRIPSKLRRSGKLAIDVIQKGNPTLKNIPLDHGALPVSLDHYLLHTGWQYMKEQMIRKISRVYPSFSRFSQYRPYVDYEKWLRSTWKNPFLKMVEDQKRFQESYFQRDRILDFARQFLEGKTSNVTLLSRLITIDFIYGTWLKFS